MSVETALQLGVIIVCSAARYCLLGYAFSILYRSVGYVDFAFGSAFTIAPMVVAVLAALSFAAPVALAVGLLTAPVVLAPLMNTVAIIAGGPDHARRPELVFIASLGVFIVVESLLGVAVGDAAQRFVLPELRDHALTSPVILTWAQIVTLVAAPIIVASVWLLLQRSSFGLRMRALQESASTLKEWGEHLPRLRLGVYALCFGMAGAAGLLFALDADPEPRMGLEANLIGVFVALFARGRGSAALLIGALAIAAIEQMATYAFGGMWKVFVLFLAALVLLSLRSRERDLITTITGGERLRV